LTKAQKQFSGERVAFSTNNAETIGLPEAKREPQPKLTPCIKIKYKLNVKLNVKL
jgi:hypothetical protein